MYVIVIVFTNVADGPHHTLLARDLGTIGFESWSSMAIDANVAVGRDFWRESFTTLGDFVDLLLDTATAYATTGSRGAVTADVCGVFRV